MPAAIDHIIFPCIHHQHHQKGLQGMETAQQHIAQQELCAASINRDGEQHRVQKVEVQLMHVFFTVRVDVYKTVACNESICANL